MSKILGVNVSSIIHRTLSPKLNQVTLVRKSPGNRQDNLTAGVDSLEVEHTGRGLIYDYSDSQVDGSLIKVGDRVVGIVGDSIDVVPATNDLITISGVSYTVIRVKVDPAGAFYECQVRR